MNKGQLYQSFRQSVKEQNLKPKIFEDLMPSRVKHILSLFYLKFLQEHRAFVIVNTVFNVFHIIINNIIK